METNMMLDPTKTSRVFNFAAGPSALPTPVLQQVQQELLDYKGTGLSIMEMSHRSDLFQEVITQAESDLRDLLGIPEDYAVLFMQGGASLQFSAVALNLMSERAQADYVITGTWSKKAFAEAKRFGTAHAAANTETDRFSYIPPFDDWSLSPDADYVHITPNETIEGVEFSFVPNTGPIPLVADVSSTILSRPLNVGAFGLLYAGAQKNIGPAGLTLVIIRKSLLQAPIQTVPTLLRYDIQSQKNSMLNTPPTFAIYIAGLVFQWLKSLGGLNNIAQINQHKASKLYEFIDQHEFYTNPVRQQDRSWMNVPFTLHQPKLDAQFLAGAEAAGLTNLKGHRSVGGMRASLYNAVSEQAVDALLNYMNDFATQHG